MPEVIGGAADDLCLGGLGGGLGGGLAAGNGFTWIDLVSDDLVWGPPAGRRLHTYSRRGMGAPCRADYGSRRDIIAGTSTGAPR
ncbi:hypothetical protein IscW_ISCW006040 [Ixodes scapularis]|uniref:Uncharacterized protein n=1 Tax=Ixodes scapularis TaxID=6945 RepID=B7PNS7_IXOSC|nr:hypothetical protein IscW_ISCW006040 [Ixodes scapularis]|eukprot:XP_002435419.1 hypothetical protein IscW_ISCW006040 [Ixodes scapularis]